MIELNIEQMSPEWFKEKAGVLSASSFDKIITAGGQPSKQVEKYMRRLAGEILIGRKVEGYQSAAMERGILMEEEARKFYVWHFGSKVRQVGMCFKDEAKMVACSPDGLIDPHGGLEIKCPELHTHVGYMLNPQQLVKDYYQQLQGSLYVTGRVWWDIMSYYPELDPVKLRVTPIQLFQEKLNREIQDFVRDLPVMVSTLKKEALPTPSTPKPQTAPQPGPNDLN